MPMVHSKSSKKWLEERAKDKYVKKSKQAGYRSRASFKLLEIQEKDNVIKPGMTVVDLGCAPGGWSQVAKNLVGDKGIVLASDILPMTPIPGVRFIQGDFTDDSVFEDLITSIKGESADLVISDMAVNTTGNKSVDSLVTGELCIDAMNFAIQLLSKKGSFVSKLFMGSSFNEIVALGKKSFKDVDIFKPPSSRKESKENFIICRNLR